MTSLRINLVTKRFNGAVALDEVELTIEAGELFFLLGPSGAGKTTLLRCLAGFCRPDHGRIFFGDTDVTDVPPHRRNVGMMFQGNALWPHLTVAGNVAFGLEEHGVARAEIRRRVAEALESVQLLALAERRPSELSGGQQQRAALARALVVRPRCLLLDEPLSNLDASLRQELRAEIKRICRDFRLTTLFVTHDQKEAFALSDRVAILEHGRVLQIGTADALYRRPHSRAVANFLGDSDCIQGRLVAAREGQARVDTGFASLDGVIGNPASTPPVGAQVSVLVRPECWSVHGAAPGPNALPGRIREVLRSGELVEYFVAVGDCSLKVVELNRGTPRHAVDQAVYLTAAPEDTVVLS